MEPSREEGAVPSDEDVPTPMPLETVCARGMDRDRGWQGMTGDGRRAPGASTVPWD